MKGGTVLSYIVGQYLSRNTGSVSLLGACYMFFVTASFAAWPYLTGQRTLAAESFGEVPMVILGVLLFGLVAAVIGGFVAMLDGLACGLASGVVIGILAQWVLPRTLPLGGYKVAFRAVGLAVSLIVSLAVLPLLLTWLLGSLSSSNIGLTSFGLVVLPSLIAALPNWWIGGRTAHWYAHKVRALDSGSTAGNAE